MVKRFVCRCCREDTPKRMVIHKKPFEEVKITEEDRKKGIIRERICKNVIKIRLTREVHGIKYHYWEEEICNNHILRIRGKLGQKVVETYD